jgi:hypothetical protein
MPVIDIALPDELTQALTPPACIDLSLPKPEMPTLTLPIGGKLQGVADITRGIPTECSMNFSLMLQIAPIMASMECLLKILKFIGTVVSVLESMTNPPAILSGIPKIIGAAADLKDCIGLALPTGPLCFLKDLLALIAAMLKCVGEALESVLAVMSGLQIQIAAATAAGNDDALAALQCAQENAQNAAEGAMQSLQPIMVLLQLASPFMIIAGKTIDVSIPSAVPASELQSMQTLVQTLVTVAKTLEEIAKDIPC